MLKYTWPQYIPCDASLHGSFMTPVMASIKLSVLLRGQDGSQYEPALLVIVPPQYQSDDSTPLIPETSMSPGRYIALDYDAYKNSAIFLSLGVKVMGPDDFIRGLQRMDSSRARTFSTQTREWQEQVCSILHNLIIQRRSPHLNKIKYLRIAPLANGEWVSATTPDVYFDANLDDIPTDLTFKFVDRLNKKSSHFRLLQDIGITEAAANDIIAQIQDKHQGPNKRLDRNTVLSHARFIHKYSSSSSFPTIKVLCADNQLCEAKEVYMDLSGPGNPADLQPSALLGLYGARSLHSSYYDVAPSMTSARSAWLKWLRECLSIHTCPRIVHGSYLSPEFSRFVSSAPTSLLLRALHHCWKDLSSPSNDLTQIADRT